MSATHAGGPPCSGTGASGKAFRTAPPGSGWWRRPNPEGTALPLAERRHTLQRRFDRRLRAGIGKAHELAAVDAVEVDARGGAHSRHFQQIGAEAHRVVGE